jgi:hypothetical protein
MQAIATQVLPFGVVYCANRKIKKQSEEIEKNPSANPSPSNISIEVIKEIYESTISAKSILEDKLKQNIASITIASSLIIGLLALLGSGAAHLRYGYFAWVIYCVASLTLLYMVIAGYISISTLAGKNIVHRLSIDELTLTENERKDKYFIYNRLNTNLNLSRNNYLFASYLCMRNALIFLMILFFIIALPISNFINKKNYSHIQTENFLYSSNSIEFLNRNMKIVEFEKIFMQNIDINSLSDDEKAFIVESCKLFIRVLKVNDKISILQIETYQNP